MAKALKIALWNEIQKKRPEFLMNVVVATYTSDNPSVSKTLEDHLQNIHPAVHNLAPVISGCLKCFHIS
jgi:hypothetical protein